MLKVNFTLATLQSCFFLDETHFHKPPLWDIVV